MVHDVVVGAAVAVAAFSCDDDTGCAAAPAGTKGFAASALAAHEDPCGSPVCGTGL